MLFNYSTGPVELSAATRSAFLTAPSSSHEIEAQQLIAETLDLVERVLGLSADFTTILLPGSIRQALDAVIGALCRPNVAVHALVTGYWGQLLADLASQRGATVSVSGPAAIDLPCDVVLAVHVETEFGSVVPVASPLKAARALGAITVVDAACSIPADGLDLDAVDIMVLGSHKVLGGAPGLGIVAVRRSAMDRLLDGAGWSLRAYAHDALLKHDYLSGARPTPSGLPPLMTYPIQIVCALRAALRERLAGGLEGGTHAAAAQALRDGLRNIGITPYGAAAVSNAVIRADLPDGVSAEALRAELALRGIFVIGGIGGSGAGSFIRIGTMSSPQLDGANIQRLIEALDDSLTAVGRARSGSSHTR